MRLLLSLFLFCFIGFYLHTTALNNDAEEKTCLALRDKLFEGVDQAKAIRDEFERFMPVYVKTQFDVKAFGSHDEFNVLGPVGPRCRGNIEKYGEGDMEKRACGLKQLEKLHRVDESGHSSECVIYSIGSNNNWGFEEAVFNQTNCRIETFDCTLRPDVTQPPEAIRSRTRLHRVCLGDSDYTIKKPEGTELQFLSWASMNKLTGLTTQPTFLKIDIEGYEFPVLLSIINSGKQLPLQMAIEVHMIRMEHGKYRRDWHVPLIELYSFMQTLYKFGGYYLVDRNDNPYCTHCTEILLAKLDCKNHPKQVDALQQLTNKAIQPKRLADSIKFSLDAKYYE